MLASQKFSVKIPTNERIRSSLERAINSVLNQSHMVNQIIIVDDGSTDGTKEIIKEKSSFFEDNFEGINQEVASGQWKQPLDRKTKNC